MTSRLPLTILSSTDPVLRDAMTMGLVLDSPGALVVRHDLVTTPDGTALRRVVLTGDGVVEDVVVPLDHACLSCAVREDAVPTLRRLAAGGDADALVLALPVSADSLPVTRTLAPETHPGGMLEGLRLAAVVTTVDAGTFEHDLLGDDLLAERDLALTPDDRRSVGEALAAQVAHADVVVAGGATPGVASDLLDHVRASDGVRIDGLHHIDPRRLFGHRHDPVVGETRTDPRRTPASHGPTGHGVWTVDLRSERPFHPQRLLDRIEDLGARRVRSRGVFWVPTRPDSVCLWDGSGGQLSIGEIGPWGLLGPRTRLVVTGTGAEAPGLRSAFEDALLTADEWRAGLAPWLGAADVLEPWLGNRHHPA
jgi:G3E family GTPase